LIRCLILNLDVSDTLDLVPIGAFHGKGKRKGCYGSYVMGAFDKRTNVFYAICKTGTGFKEEQLTELTEVMKKFKATEKPVNYITGAGLKPDVWFHPHQVWEISADCFSQAAVHKPRSVSISLRFPRFVRERPDKRLEDSTDMTTIEEMITGDKMIVE
jgi:DNA ligase 1